MIFFYPPGGATVSDSVNKKGQHATTTKKQNQQSFVCLNSDHC